MLIRRPLAFIVCVRAQVELVPGGADMDVIEANKHEYVRLIAQRKLVTSIEPQLKSFLEGFYEIVPPELLCLFTETELELLISGLPTIDGAYHAPFAHIFLHVHTFHRGFSAIDRSSRRQPAHGASPPRAHNCGLMSCLL